MRRSSCLGSPALFAFLLLLSVTAGTRGAAAHGTVMGQVTDEQGQALSGANVEVVGTGMGAVADDDGNYNIANVPEGTYSVRASLIGYGQKTMKDVEVADDDVTVDFSIRERPIPLSSTVISASAINEDVRRAPNKVNIIDRTQLEATPARVMQDVLQNVEGLYITRGQGLLVDFQTIVIRGLHPGQFGRNSGALIMLNGHNINGSLGSWYTIGDLDLIPLDLIQKSEVIKGPYTSTYGSGATGGVINVLTQKNFSAPMGGSLSIRTGAYNLRSITPIIHGQKNNISYAAWGEFLHGEERVGRRRSTWSLESGWGDGGYLAKGRVEQSKYGFMVGYDINATDRIDILGTRLEKFNNYDGRALTGEQINSELIHVTYARQLDDDYRLQVRGNWLNNIYDLTADNAPADPTATAKITRFQPFPGRALGVKAELTGLVAARHRVIAGVEWRRETVSRTSWWGNRESLEFDIRGTQDLYSFFLEDKITLGKLEVTPGVRLEQWKDEAVFSVQEVPDEDARPDIVAPGWGVHVGYNAGENTSEAVSPKVGVAYLLSDDVKLRASAGRTFRVPRITETYSPNYQTLINLIYLANPDLEASTIISYEGGVDYATADRSLYASFTAYIIDAGDHIEATITRENPDAPRIVIHDNLDLKISGFEGEVGYQLMEDLALSGNFNFLTHEYDGGPFDGSSTPHVPNQTFNINADYAPIDGLKVRLAVQRIGRIFEDSANNSELDAYQLFNLNARYTLPGFGSDSYRLEASVTNLADKDYTIPRVWDYQPHGRALYLGIGYDF